MKRAGGTRVRLPPGVERIRLTPHRDLRGAITELLQTSGRAGAFVPRQWTLVETDASVVRGVHVHVRHDDLFVLVSGSCWLGLCDVRGSSRRAGGSGIRACLELTSAEREAWLIPHGVAHGMWFPEPGVCLQGSSEHFDPGDDVRCRFDDPELGIPWPEISFATTSRCDAEAQSFTEMQSTYRLRARASSLRSASRSRNSR